jgi:hypothetical protein
MTDARRKERIPETATGSLGGTWVAAANGWLDDYTLPDGRQLEGPTMLLVFKDDSKVRVGAGCEIDANGIMWTVTEVQLGDAGTGWVELEAAIPEDKGPASPEELDFIFSDRCYRCGAKNGWDGTTGTVLGEFAIGMRCTQCSASEWETSGEIRRAFFESPPVFQPGRRR